MGVSEHQAEAAKQTESIGCGVLTVSDTRTMETDTSGGLIVELLEAAGHRIVHRAIVPDEPDQIGALLTQWIADSTVRAILSTGGTGVSRRDTTVEVAQAPRGAGRRPAPASRLRTPKRMLILAERDGRAISCLRFSGSRPIGGGAQCAGNWAFLSPAVEVVGPHEPGETGTMASQDLVRHVLLVALLGLERPVAEVAGQVEAQPVD